MEKWQQVDALLQSATTNFDSLQAMAYLHYRPTIVNYGSKNNYSSENTSYVVLYKVHIKFSFFTSIAFQDYTELDSFCSFLYSKLFSLFYSSFRI